MQLLIQNARVQKQPTPVDIAIDKGRISEISPHINCSARTVIDAANALVSPAFIDPHNHLDKPNILDILPSADIQSVDDAVRIIREFKSGVTRKGIVERGEEVIRRALKNGTLHMRTHVDVDQFGGLTPLAGVVELKGKYRNAVDIQIVAFPQEPIAQNPENQKLMEAAMQNGASIVGGMPANEPSPADSLAQIRFCFRLAEKYNADIDMHIDETDDPFFRTLEMLADETLLHGYTGRVTAGHTCALAAYDDHYAACVIEKVAKANISVITNPVTNLILQGRRDHQPVRRGITRVKELLQANVCMSFGQDNYVDNFYPFGSADMLQIANITAHAAQMSLPDEIEKVFDMMTVDAARILKLEDYGLLVGAKANLVIIHAENARDAIRLAPERPYVIREGEVVVRTTSCTEYKL